MMTGLTRWSPFDELWTMFDLFDRQLGTWSLPGSSPLDSGMRFSRDESGWRGRIALPGIAPENVQVEVTGRMLHVTAAERDGDSRALRYEQYVSLPEWVDAEKISATFRHGLLEVTAPYAESLRPRRIEISTDEPKRLQQAA